MQIFQGSSNFSRIEARIVFRDTLSGSSLECTEEFAAAAILHAQVQVVFRLERVIQRYDERVVTGGKDFLLCQGTLDLVSLNHFLFAQHYKVISQRCDGL